MPAWRHWTSRRRVKRLAAEVHERDGVELLLRVGLNSGQVIAGEIGSGPFGYTTIGEQVGMARRMESVAPPGGVMLSDSTARLVEHAAVLGEPERVSIKGSGEPVTAHRLLGVAVDHESMGPAQPTLVGRDVEQCIADRFDSSLHAPVAELLEIGQHAHVDVPLGSRHVDVNGVEVIPTPGHSPGSICYLVDGAEGKYLFTGDTMVLGDSGAWWAGYIAGISDADALAASLRLLRTLTPDVVISSAYQGDSAVTRIDAGRWPEHVDQALEGLTTALAQPRTRYM